MRRPDEDEEQSDHERGRGRDVHRQGTHLTESYL